MSVEQQLHPMGCSRSSGTLTRAGCGCQNTIANSGRFLHLLCIAWLGESGQNYKSISWYNSLHVWVFTLHWIVCISTLIIIWEMMNSGIIIYKIRIYCRVVTLARIKSCFKLHTVKISFPRNWLLLIWTEVRWGVLPPRLLYRLYCNINYFHDYFTCCLSICFISCLPVLGGECYCNRNSKASLSQSTVLNVTPSNHSCVGGTRTLWVGKIQCLIVIMQMSLFISYPEAAE